MPANWRKAIQASKSIHKRAQTRRGFFKQFVKHTNQHQYSPVSTSILLLLTSSTSSSSSSFFTNTGRKLRQPLQPAARRPRHPRRERTAAAGTSPLVRGGLHRARLQEPGQGLTRAHGQRPARRGRGQLVEWVVPRCTWADVPVRKRLSLDGAVYARGRYSSAQSKRESATLSGFVARRIGDLSRAL